MAPSDEESNHRLESTDRERNAISLFSGGGGLDLGAEAAGFTTRVCLDNDAASCKTLERNRNRTINGKPYLTYANVLCADISECSAAEILRAANIMQEELDLVYGGPPCQAFSILGKRKGMEDPRGTVLMQFVRIMHDLLPKAFLLENVPGLASIGGGEILQDLIDALKQDGSKYAVSAFTLKGVAYGVPQHRERIIIIGTRIGGDITPPRPTHGTTPASEQLLKYNTVSDAFETLPETGSRSVPNHAGRNHSSAIKRRYATLQFSERDPTTRVNKLDPNKPGYTVVAGNKGHVHPFEPREVTPRESARLQTFPDAWEFTGSRRAVIRQVGNAVPPVFAARLFAHIRKTIFKQKDVPSPKQLASDLGQRHLRF